jgi:proteasome alpha subunit
VRDAEEDVIHRAAVAAMEANPMSMPFYVAPEQLVRDKAEFARKGIARGRSIVALEYATGVLILAENPSGTLRKIAEVYDRIAFAGVGKYNEFETLRKAGIRQADLMGYLYSRETSRPWASPPPSRRRSGRSSPTSPSPTRSRSSSRTGMGESDENKLYRIAYDGTLFDESRYVAIGGKADALTEALQGCGREG